MMEYFALVWRQVRHQWALSHHNQHQLKKVFQLTLLYSKMMMDRITCISAEFGEVNYNVGVPGPLKQKGMARFFIYQAIMKMHYVEKLQD